MADHSISIREVLAHMEKLGTADPLTELEKYLKSGELAAFCDRFDGEPERGQLIPKVGCRVPSQFWTHGRLVKKDGTIFARAEGVFEFLLEADDGWTAVPPSSYYARGLFLDRRRVVEIWPEPVTATAKKPGLASSPRPEDLEVGRSAADSPPSPIGRPKGSSSLKNADDDVVMSIRKMISEGKASNPSEAAKKMLRTDPTSIAGNGSDDSKIKRVVARYKTQRN